MTIWLTLSASLAWASAPDGYWWNLSYGYRQKVTVTAGAQSAPSAYAIRFQLDHAALVAAGKSLASGADLRIVYWNGSGWTELDRRLDDESAWNSPSTRVWFRTQALVDADSGDDNYYVYYGNSGAGDPPSNWSNVFLFYDDFSSAGLDTTTRWSCNLGTCTQTGGELRLDTYSALQAQSAYALGTDTRWEARVRLGGDGTVQYFNFLCAVNNVWWEDDYIAFWTNATQHLVEITENGTGTATNAVFANAAATSFQTYAFTREGITGVRFHQQGVEVDYLTTGVPGTTLRPYFLNDSATAGGIVLDWVRVRKYVSPEPVSTMGADEAAPLGLFRYRKQITIDHTKVGTSCASNLNDFPVLISISGDTSLKSKVNGGNVESSTGNDIIFRAADGTTMLYHEIQRYDGATGDLIAWVRLPTISKNTATSFFIYYGNTGISSPTENKAGVWDSNYESVLHLQESGSGSANEFADSTSNGHHGTGGGWSGGAAKTPDRAAGVFGYAQDFIPANQDHIKLNAVADGAWSEVTVQAWVNQDFVQDARVFAKTWSTNAADIVWFLGVSGNNKIRLRTNSSALDGLAGTSLTNGAWTHYAFTWSAGSPGSVTVFRNGQQDSSWTIAGSDLYDNATAPTIGNSNTLDRTFDGRIQEARLSKVARSACWIQTEYNNQSSPSTFYSVGPEQANPTTAISLIEFSAAGQGTGVTLVWQTAQEVRNKGFTLYRADHPHGGFLKLNAELIPSASVSGEGRSYRFVDGAAVRGRLYYYKLEDVDVSGARTRHGPVCVDWDADGIADDWEIAHGLDSAVNDADSDPDGDGVANGLEYRRGTDPRSRDTDGDGVADGDERKGENERATGLGLGAMRGVEVVSSDAEGMTLELWTPGFDTTPVSVAGEIFERLRVTSYVHGFMGAPGRPQLPVKGLLIEVPEGRAAKLAVLSVSEQERSGYRLYPVPEHEAAEGALREVFTWDEAAYAYGGFEPAPAAELSLSYLFGGGVRQRLVFYPFAFNAATGVLLQRERVRVRVDFVAAGPAALARTPAAALSAVAAGAWAPPRGYAAFKLATAAEGIHRVTRDWLGAQGIGPTEIDAIDLSQVRLFHLGVEQAIEVNDGNGNGRLEAADTIVFYAAPVPEAHRKHARHNCYWLVNGGGAGALRMAPLAGAPAGGVLAASHASTHRHERDQLYLQSAPGADGLDRWIFSTIAVGPGFDDPQAGLAKEFTLSLPGAQGPGELTLRLYSPYDLAHTVTVAVNGVEAGTAAWSGIGFGEANFTGVSFTAGTNTVSIRCTGSTDKAGVDWIKALYERSFAATADSLKFSHAGGSRYQLTGFTSSDIALYDITDPAAVGRVVGGAVSGSGPYRLETEPAAAVGSRTYLAVASAAVLTPAEAVADTPSNLSDPAEGADWVLVTSRALGRDEAGSHQGWVQSLVALRTGQGLRCAMVDVTDIFDEFGYGFATPAAIRAFLSHAYANWPQPAPRYVLLVGDATYDPKNNWGISPAPVSHVPAWLIATTHLGETATDERYVQFDAEGGGAAMAIGRLPAATLAQAEAMAAKIVSYETVANTKSWQRRVVLAADNAIAEWEAAFETMGEDAAALLPAGMAPPQRFYLQEYENEQLAVSDLTAELLAAVDSGALILHYSGHGSLNLWASERMIDNRGGAFRADVDSLANRGMYPFVVNMACLSGYFIYPFAGASWQSLAEGFMRTAEAGAVAALMPTAMTPAYGQQVLSNSLFEALFAEDQRRLGDALGTARRTLLANGGEAYQETADTFMLFGDPATRLRVPLPRRPLGLSAARQGALVALSWQPALDADGSPVAGYHIYRRAAGEAGFRRITQEPLNALAFTDTPPTGLAAEGAWQYALTSVDSDGLESVLSAAAALTPNPNQESEPSQSVAGVGNGGGCFVSAVAAGGPLRGPAAGMLMALIALPAVLRALRPKARKLGRPAPAAGLGLRRNPCRLDISSLFFRSRALSRSSRLI